MFKPLTGEVFAFKAELYFIVTKSTAAFLEVSALFVAGATSYAMTDLACLFGNIP